MGNTLALPGDLPFAGGLSGRQSEDLANMLSLEQFYTAMRHVESIEDFERWIRRKSRNVHAWGTPELIEAVLTAEAVLSEYRFGGMEENLAIEALTRIGRPERALPLSSAATSAKGHTPNEAKP